MHEQLSLTDAEDLTGQVKITEKFPSRCGGDSDVFRGILTGRHAKAGMQVAVKVFRGANLNNTERIEHVKKVLKREPRVGYDLHHNNILPLLGYTTDVAQFPALVSPFCEQYSVAEYLRKHPNADRAQMIFQIAQGLEYLHSRKIVHMDLKTRNVLVSDEGRPLICDFGRSKILEEKGVTTTTVFDTTRFMAPELIPRHGLEGSALDDFVPIFTQNSDVYAFGMVGLEVLSGEEPFYKTNHTLLPRRILEGLPIADYVCPPEYVGTWRVITPCWKMNPADRPEMVELIRDLPRDRRG